MSYGIDATNDQALSSMSQTHNPNQLDITTFSDFHQPQTPGTGTSFLDGGSFITVRSATPTGVNITTNSVAALSAFGYTGCSGVMTLSTTAVTSSYTGIVTSSTLITNLLTGMPTPSSGLITKYEYETLIRTSTPIFADTNRGTYRIGFQNTATNTVPTTGVFFQFLCDGTTTDTNWMIVFISSSGSTRVDTGVAVSTNTTYRMYLSTEVNSGGTYTTKYKIKNMTTGTNTEGTASPSSNTHYPSTTEYMAANLVNSRVTSLGASSATVLLFLDYICVRIRKPMTREILIAP